MLEIIFLIYSNNRYLGENHMGISFWQILIVVALLVILFGRGKISELMGDVAKGVKSFKKGINDDDESNSINKSEDNSNKE